MEARQRITNLVVVVAPLVAGRRRDRRAVGHRGRPRDLAIMAVFYVLTIAGITVGFHRYLTHHGFGTHKPVAYGLAVLGSMAAQGPVITWVAGHRKHHAFPDVDGDPHSPHPSDGTWRGALRSTWHSHAGWLWSERAHRDDDRPKYAPDLLEDRGYSAIDRHYVPIVLAGLALPALAGFVLSGGTAAGALGGFVWGGVVRMALLLHVTGSVNSLCHVVGERRFDLQDESRNIALLSLLTFGEAWHHNHHAFPRSAMHGLRPWELDPAGWTITAMEHVGLAWDVVRIAPERQLARQAA